MCKPCVNQILPCANHNQLCVNFFAPYAKLQPHNSQQFQRVLQNPLVTLPIFMCLLRAAHSWFNQVKSLFGTKKRLVSLYHSFTGFAPRCSPGSAAAWLICSLLVRGHRLQHERAASGEAAIGIPRAASSAQERCESTASALALQAPPWS
jgi:hypothetical protein